MKITRYRMVEEEDYVPTTLNGFRKWEFTSGSTTGEDFKVFAKLFKASIHKALSPSVKLVKFDIGHYYLSGFIQKDGKFAYFSISDVRHFPGQWHSNILVRTAQSATDYTGGSNGYTTLEHFSEAVDGLLSVKRLRLPA